MSPTRGRFLLLSLIVAVLSGLLFTPGLPGNFVFDDHPNIVNNKAIQLETLSTDGLYRAVATPQMSGNMRVLPTLTFALDYWRGGGADPATFKTTNIIIHAITALALAWFFRSLLLIAGVSTYRAQWAATALALGWALHPLQVSSVLYAVQRLQTMGTMFLVLALLAYLKARQTQFEGGPARTWWMLTALLWVFALSCKEDSVLLPAYTLALELTVLRFGAKEPHLAKALKRSYILAAAVGLALYVLVVIPHYWRWDAYGGRDFSTPERLLTQARVLCMYLWQILLPLPQHMPFYYDWIQPSRGLLQPWTTLPAIALLLALLATAWKLRNHRPLVSLGILMFFAAHFITSNVVGLELAFEHRNSFALIGAVLAIGSLIAHLFQRLCMPSPAQATIASVLLVILGTNTLLRAHDWRSNLTLGLASTQSAPTSARAWVGLCADYFKAGGGIVATNPNLEKAIAACHSGTISAPYALNNYALLIVLKSLRGDITPEDWNRYQQQLESAHMNWDNRRSIQILMHHSREGVELDKLEMLKAIATISRRTEFGAFQLAAFGYYIMNDLGEPEIAMPYFVKAIEASPSGDPFPWQLGNELREKGRQDLAETIEQLGYVRPNAPSIPVLDGQ